MVDSFPPPSTPKPRTIPPQPPVLPPNPTPVEVVTYLRALAIYADAIAWAVRTQNTELSGIRAAVQEQGGRIENFCARIERSVDRLQQAVEKALVMRPDIDTEPPASAG